VADEPTQGVDVGARAEIYRILREITESGTPIVVNSSDAAELEGLCDKVVVLSRGRVVRTLTGSDVIEANIVSAAVSAEHHVDAEEGDRESRGAGAPSGWRHFLQTDNAPAVPLAVVAILLALYGYAQNPNFLSSFNVYNTLILATALGFIGLGQTIALLLGGVDLSVGPLAGFLVVVASFFVNDGQPWTMIAAGFLLMLIGAIVVGAINGCLIRFASFTPIAATLAMYIGLQGVSFLLRDVPDGYINSSVVEVITAQLGPIPAAFIVLALGVAATEYALRNTRAGWQLRCSHACPSRSSSPSPCGPATAASISPMPWHWWSMRRGVKPASAAECAAAPAASRFAVTPAAQPPGPGGCAHRWRPSS